jgi:hypothetical protein
MSKFEKPDTPFPRNWLSYISVKFLILAIAVLITLHWLGVL